MLSVASKATARSVLKQSRVFSAQHRRHSPTHHTAGSSPTIQQAITMSSSPSLPSIATKTHGIEKSVWVEFIQLALEVKPLNLGQGFPDFAAPDHVRKALSEAAVSETNFLLNQYTRGFGHPRLVNAISKVYSKVVGREINPMTEVLVTAGAYEALFVSIMGLVNPGDEVIIIEPFFDCYVPQVKLAGGTPVFVPLRPKKTEGVTSSADWVLDPAELAAAFNSKTKAIVVNTPNNPLGKVYKKEELMMIADLCKKYNSVAIMDEVYEWMTYTGQEHCRMATLPGMWDRCITIGSAGKTFSVTGWKIGWAYGPTHLLKGPQVIHQHSVYTCTTPVQEAVAQGFEKELELYGTPECYLESLAVELEVKRDMIVKLLIDAGLNPIVPEGGYFILADVRDIVSKVDIGGDPNERKDFRFVKWLSRNRKLQGIPPSAFYSPEHGDIGENYIRFCFIKEDKNLQKAGEILLALKKDIDEGKV
uniref:Aminotransferase class I/classII large domain-containing protein n=1 Tax=Scylla olivacea TaxID=85551 RepID=A0A0N7ZB94_SCYOL